MAEVAGYNTTVYVGGTATGMTAEAMTGSGAGPYQVTDTAKRVLDPADTFTFYDNGVAINSGDILSVDYLQGKVTFTGSKTGPITVTGDYLPLLAWASCRALDLNFVADMLDTSVFGSQYKTSIQGMKEISGSAEILEALTTDLDSGGGSRSWAAVFAAGTQVVLSIIPGGSGTTRCWAVLSEMTTTLSTGELVTYGFAFASVVVVAADGTRVIPVNF